MKFRVKNLRKSTGLTQVKFSKKYNIPVRTLQDWERGERTPPVYVVELLEFKIKEEVKMVRLYLMEEGQEENY